MRSSRAKRDKAPPANKEHLTPWPPPVTRWVQKGAKPGGPDCTRPPFGRTAQAARGANKGPGALQGLPPGPASGNGASPEAEASMRQ